jgi:hypothetical protein
MSWIGSRRERPMSWADNDAADLGGARDGGMAWRANALNRWYGPIAVLAIGIACVIWASTRDAPASTVIPLSRLAAMAPTEEAPFFAANDDAMREMLAAMTVRPSGDVDRDFVDMMVAHHQGAMAMARAQLRWGNGERLHRLAREMIITQEQEIAEMWLALSEPVPPPADFHGMFPEAMTQWASVDATSRSAIARRVAQTDPLRSR